MALPSYANNRASFPEMYERWLVQPLFRPFAESAVEAAAVQEGDRVLDIACGTGIVARVARQRAGARGRVVGVDASAPMLDTARSAEPAIEWREGDAAALPVGDDERFDVVFCQQGLQFFPDKSGAAREMRRVAAPDARVIVSTWRSLDETPLFRELHRVAERHLGRVVDQRHGFADTGTLRALLEEAGFASVRVDVETRTIRIPRQGPFAQMNANAVVGMSSAGTSMTNEQKAAAAAAIAGDSEEVLRAFTDGEDIQFELSSNVARAHA